MVDIRLKDSEGRGVAGEIAFSAADAGVLNLIGYELPDPFDAFYGPRPLGVRTSVSLAELVRQRNYGQKEEDLGGGGGDNEDRMRRDFRPLAHWAPAIRTNGSGRARVTFRVPESLTTFRLMAAALTPEHAFGAGSTDLVVTQPLVLQPALPRFSRLGDTFEAGGARQQSHRRGRNGHRQRGGRWSPARGAEREDRRAGGGRDEGSAVHVAGRARREHAARGALHDDDGPREGRLRHHPPSGAADCPHRDCHLLVH